MFCGTAMRCLFCHVKSAMMVLYLFLMVCCRMQRAGMHHMQVTGRCQWLWFWEDSTHMLAWYNGTAGKTSNAAGLYRYDVLAAH